MKIFDTHSHYNLEPLYSGQPNYFSQTLVNKLTRAGWKKHWQKARENGILASLVAGADLISSQRAVKIAQTEDALYASVSIHPEEVTEKKPEKIELDWANVQTLAQDTSVVAIGETGLDYYHLPHQETNWLISQQKDLFIRHIELANKLQKPLIVHARDKDDSSQVYTDILSIIEQNYQFHKPFVLHCISGPISYINSAVKLGAYISFAGNLTYNNAHNIQKIASVVPVKRILLETDAPFLPPQAYRGKICEPWMITATAEFMKNNYKIELDEILNNSFKFFGIQND